MIKGLIFDLDGCLIDSSIVQREAYFGSYKIVVGDENCPPYEEYIKHTGDSIDNIFRKMGFPDEMSKVYIDHYKKNKKGDLELTKEYGMPKQKWYFEEEELYPDTVKCLEELSKRYKIGVIANQELGTADCLEQFGILKYIDLVVVSAEEGVAKPNKKILKSP